MWRERATTTIACPYSTLGALGAIRLPTAAQSAIAVDLPQMPRLLAAVRRPARRVASYAGGSAPTAGPPATGRRPLTIRATVVLAMPVSAWIARSDFPAWSSARTFSTSASVAR
jgi:hypothetical protein